jgi:hypothetical protein
MPPSCPHCDQPDVSLLRLVFMGEIVRADETLLATLADLLHTSGLLPLAAAKPAATRNRLPQGPQPGLRLVGAHAHGRRGGRPPSRTARSRPPRPRGVPTQR